MIKTSIQKHKVLITGGSGLLALNWACAMRDKFEIVLALHHRSAKLKGVTSLVLNLESQKELRINLGQIMPDVVIHAAGFTNVDECENNYDLATLVNCDVAANVADVCEQLQIRLVHISTDHLFSGESQFSSENQEVQLVNNYARSKYNGEMAVSSLSSRALIIRTNFFGWGHLYRKSFSDWIVGHLSCGKEITLFDDVFYTPILIDWLAIYVHSLIASNASGIFNVVSDERISKYEFGLMLSSIFGFERQLIIRSKVSSIQRLAPRPNDMSLSNVKLKQKLSVDTISLLEQVKILKQQFDDGRYAEIKSSIMEK